MLAGLPVKLPLQRPEQRPVKLPLQRLSRRRLAHWLNRSQCLQRPELALNPRLLRLKLLQCSQSKPFLRSRYKLCLHNLLRQRLLLNHRSTKPRCLRFRYKAPLLSFLIQKSRFKVLEQPH